MAKIPTTLHEHINTAFPAHVCLVGTVLPGGFAQVSPRGSTMVLIKVERAEDLDGKPLDLA